MQHIHDPSSLRGIEERDEDDGRPVGESGGRAAGEPSRRNECY